MVGKNREELVITQKRDREEEQRRCDTRDEGSSFHVDDRGSNNGNEKKGGVARAGPSGDMNRERDRDEVQGELDIEKDQITSYPFQNYTVKNGKNVEADDEDEQKPGERRRQPGGVAHEGIGKHDPDHQEGQEDHSEKENPREP